MGRIGIADAYGMVFDRQWCTASVYFHRYLRDFPAPALAYLSTRQIFSLRFTLQGHDTSIEQQIAYRNEPEGPGNWNWVISRPLWFGDSAGDHFPALF